MLVSESFLKETNCKITNNDGIEITYFASFFVNKLTSQLAMSENT